ncbi:MAG: hypothetical protein A2X78_04475 [Gammaproteobacteria bacterium GWE2_37_16]|nr:MAG: hypothetical protein A2X78_04475 [Gammaproteobacteria bacterium GWE2_37_16]
MRGFSFLEILLALALTAILGAISVPAIYDLVCRNAIFTRVDHIVNTLQFARTAAVGCVELVMFCKSKDRKQCEDVGVSWSDGQIVVADNDRGEQKLLQVVEALPVGDILEWHSNFSQNESLGFLPSGTTNGQHGSFYYCPLNHPQYSRAIIINENGRVYVSDKTAEGEVIRCNKG